MLAFWTLYLFTNVVFVLGFSSVRNLRQNHGSGL